MMRGCCSTRTQFLAQKLHPSQCFRAKPFTPGFPGFLFTLLPFYATLTGLLEMCSFQSIENEVQPQCLCTLATF